jgi:saccharopine dehydrogenase-like NADP-dependent oxidoreductase
MHGAGPFARTSRPMDACLPAGAHHLDIRAEIAVFEALAARDVEAKASGVMLLPGVGVDVVPSDCLAAHLARRLLRHSARVRLPGINVPNATISRRAHTAETRRARDGRGSLECQHHRSVKIEPSGAGGVVTRLHRSSSC